MGKELPFVTNYGIELPFVALYGRLWPCMIFCGRVCVDLSSYMAFSWSFMVLVLAFLWTFIAKYRFYYTSSENRNLWPSTRFWQ